jgi:glycosyltransferase involved in cell wall biosynthesis
VTLPERGERRIAMLVRNPYTHDSRVEKEAATLRGAGHEVIVVADHVAGLPQREVRDGVEVRRVPRARFPIPGLRFLLHEWRLIQVLTGLRPSVLHAHDSNALVPVSMAARRLRRPFVYDAHDLWLHRPRRQRSRPYHALQNAYYRVVEGVLVPRAAATITVSAPIARYLERAYRLRRVDLVPNYPLPEEVTRTDATAARRAMGSIPDGVPIVLYLGGLMEGRGIEHLVRSMVDVPEAQLALLGAGHQATALIAEAVRIGIEQRVHVLDPVPPADVVPAAATATIGVSPIVPSCLNYRYSLPNKLFQYMAAGIPVVASDFPQIRDVVVGTGAGLVVDTRRPAAIAAAINELLADPARAREMGRRGREAVERMYNWSTAADTLIGVYRRLIGDRLD